MTYQELLKKKKILYDLARGICGRIPEMDRCTLRRDPGGYCSLLFDHEELGPSQVTALLYPGGALAGARLGEVTIPMEQYDLPAAPAAERPPYRDEKDVFVHWLKPVVLLCDRSLKDLEYLPDHPLGQVVRLKYSTAHRDINVTGSSCLWIGKKVFEALEY